MRHSLPPRASCIRAGLAACVAVVGALIVSAPAAAQPRRAGLTPGMPPAPLTAPRVPPLAESDLSPDQRALVQKYARGAPPGNALRTLVRVPALADRVFPAINYVAFESTLPPRHREILILRTAWLTQCATLWAAHASRPTGLTSDEVIEVARGAGGGWSPFERRLITLADELFRNASVSDATWTALTAEYDLFGAMDAVVTVAESTTDAILFNTLGIQPDAGSTARLPRGDVAYRVDVPEREAPLAAPRVEPVPGDGLRIGRTLARHPALAAAWNANPSYVLNPERSGIVPHDRELLILRTGWDAQAVYEWAKHVGSVGRAREHGLDPVRIARGREAPGWNANERALIDAADEMYRDTFISDATWTTLSAGYDTHQMMSIVLTAARYRKVSMVLNALGVQPLPDDERFPRLDP